MRVLVTGATGFTGGHLARHLAKDGYEVAALVRDPARAADLERAGILDDQVRSCEPVCGRSDQNLPRPRGLLESRRKVHGLAGCEGGLGVLHNELAGLDADPRFEPELFDSLAHRERGTGGTLGVVTGKSGRFSEQVICHFPRETRARMAVGDQIVIRSEGVGMTLAAHPEVMLKGIAPSLLSLLPVRSGAVLEVGVVARIPVGKVPSGIVSSADAVWVVVNPSDTSSSLVRIDPARNRVTTRIPAPRLSIVPTPKLIGDDRAFSGPGLGDGWAWDDLAWGYAAPVSALQANVDAAEVRIAPRANECEPATVTLGPAESGLRLE